MKYFLLLCIFFTSCAHNFKYAENFETNKSPSVLVSIQKGVIDMSAKCREDNDCNFKNKRNDFILNSLFNITSDDKAEYEITQIQVDTSTIGPECLNGIFSLFLISTATVGIVPVYHPAVIKAQITIRNKVNNNSKLINIDADHTTGGGWLFWIKTWRGKDHWNWSSEVPERYVDNDKQYLSEYGSWLLNNNLP
jgi:hypothetical protein